LHAVTVHVVPHLTNIGMDRAMAATGVAIFSMVGLGMRVLYGAMADIFVKKYIYALSNLVTAVSLVIFGLLEDGSLASLAVFGVIYGIGISGAMTVRVPITREYFGVKKFGSIYGMLSVFTVLGGVMGAPIAGWVYDSSGTYFPIWFIFAGLTAFGVILLLLLPSSESVKARHVIG
jgi:MFS family permease